MLIERVSCEEGDKVQCGRTKYNRDLKRARCFPPFPLVYKGQLFAARRDLIDRRGVRTTKFVNRQNEKDTYPLYHPQCDNKHMTI